MKKLLSLLLCLALLAGLFAGTALAEAEPEKTADAETTEEIAEAETAEETAEAETTEETAEAETTEEEPSFTAEIGAQAFAMTMAAWMAGCEGEADLSDPLLLWDAVGWYAAWRYRTEDCDLLSLEEIGDFLASLGQEEAAELPAGWEEYEVVRVLHDSAGQALYDFAQHKVEIDAMLGVNTMVSTVAGEDNTATTVLSCFYDEGLSGEWMYELRFAESGEEAAFPWRLTGLLLLDDGPKMDPALDFEWDALLEANRLENILAIYPSVHITDPGYSENGTWLFRHNGEMVRLSVGEGYLGGEYRGCYFDYEDAGDGVKRARIGSFREDAGSLELLDHYVSDFLTGVCIVELDREEDDLLWLTCTFRGGYRETAAVDRETLVLRELDYVYDPAFPPSVTQIDYAEPTLDCSFLDSWDGEQRTVTAIWETCLWNEEGDYTPEIRTEFHRVPADWEYLPYEGRWGEYTVYRNAGYTESYEYPGDGLDYSLYLTSAKG